MGFETYSFVIVRIWSCCTTAINPNKGKETPKQSLLHFLKFPSMFKKITRIPRRRSYISKQSGILFHNTVLKLVDPWLLPNTPEHVRSTITPPGISPPIVPPRPEETTDTMRARLLYQSRKRGTLETDLLLSTFAKEHLSTMDRSELIEYSKVRTLSECRPRL
jgi:hypothetical protein